MVSSHHVSPLLNLLDRHFFSKQPCLLRVVFICSLFCLVEVNKRTTDDEFERVFLLLILYSKHFTLQRQQQDDHDETYLDLVDLFRVGHGRMGLCLAQDVYDDPRQAGGARILHQAQQLHVPGIWW